MTGVGRAQASEHFIGRGTSRLFVRDVGDGPPIIVLHGGPSFDHRYLLPDLDRLADSFRLVYYDQRGRGRSFSVQTPDDVSIVSEVEDLERIREWLGEETVTLLGHSWGGLLAMEHATRHPDRVAHLILMSTAPVSVAGVIPVERELERRRPSEQTQRMAALAVDPRYQAGDVETDIEYYRQYFAPAFRDEDMLERLLRRLRATATAEGILAARKIARRLKEETLDAGDYDLMSRLGRVSTPTLLLHGDEDFIPVAVVQEIAAAIKGAELKVLAGRGHFAYIEDPDAVKAAIATFLSPR